jgi:transposase
MLYARQPTEEEYTKLRGMTRQAIGRVSKRPHAILLSVQGRTVSELAAIFGVTRKTIRSWIHRFNAAGPSGLGDKPPRRHSRPLP